MTATTTYASSVTRPEPPLAGDETATLLGALERQRATLAWKCGDLDEEALGLTLGASTITLGGLLKHLALVEDEVFTKALLGRPLPAPWDAVDWAGDPDWEWHSAVDDSPERLYALWQTSVRRSRSAVRTALRAGGLDLTADVTFADGRPSLRRLVVDMIEEYARHVGHADLIRESIDGLTGEDPPSDVPAYPALES
ncbi:MULTISPECIES: DUF664 domain-containing protein [Nocardioides]|uniref:DUF664 domain-containing protein n=1 Tax=Nocardioides vastitatis TaxID=2568655 RepID=A0ABW0ZPB7_9ACTN|nr:DUF664 domain-containing protein [Nocardioides sp.]THJ04160.1 DUF664 domain-containing protein [Nocardioides sp.]